MGWFSGNNGGDGSKMKVTDSGDRIKTERISSSDRPHSHEIVIVDKVSGSVKEVSVGLNAPRGNN